MDKVGERGSITLEATIVFPFFVVFIITLAVIMKLVVAQMALQSTVSETAEQIATHYYIVTYCEDTLHGNTMDFLGGLPGMDVLNEKLPDIIKKPIVDYVANTIKTQLSNWSTCLIETGGNQLLRENADKNKLYADSRLTTDVQVDENEKTCKVTAKYKVKLPIPFFSKEVVMQAHAMESLWVGN